MVPRSLAVRILTSVLSGGEALDQAIASVSGEIPTEYRGWIQDVCSGTLRWKGRLDWAVDANALKKKPSGWLRKMLLLAAYQLFVQERTQPGAVVYETVAEIKRKEGEAPARFANALLRRLSEQASSWRGLSFPESGTPAEKANWASLPEWFWKRLEAQHGSHWAKEFAQACLLRPRIWLRSRRDDWQPGDWVRPGPLKNSWEVLKGGAIQEKEGFSAGEFIVQDLSSQFLVSEVMTAVQAGSDKKMSALDLCAAPGGKAVGMAWGGMDTVATDQESRLELLHQTAERAAPGIRVLSVDAFHQEQAGLFDLVWVDAPCSGSGIIRRHPDVRWLRREKELSSLADVQEKLAAQGWERVRPGGYLLYSVCSVFQEEGPALIERLVEKTALQGEVLKTWELSPHLPPFGDGFWAALIRKAALS